MKLISNMEYLITFKKLLLQPSEFFEKMQRNENCLNPLIFAGICNIPTFLLTTDLSYFTASYTGFLIGFIARLFVNSVILHVLWKAIGGTASLKNTFQIYAYSNVLELFAPFMGYLSILTIPYQLYIRARGGQFIHNLSLRSSTAVAIIGGIFELAEATILSLTTGSF